MQNKIKRFQEIFGNVCVQWMAENPEDYDIVSGYEPCNDSWARKIRKHITIKFAEDLISELKIAKIHFRQEDLYVLFKRELNDLRRRKEAQRAKDYEDL